MVADIRNIVLYCNHAKEIVEAKLQTFFALILVTCSHTQCDTVKPVTEDLYHTRAEWEAVSKYFTNVPLRNSELQCAEVKRK